MTSKILTLLEEQREHLTKQIYNHIYAFFLANHSVALEKNLDENAITERLRLYIDLIKKELASPTNFGIFHKRDMEPIDFYEFATSMLRPFVDIDDSIIQGKENIDHIVSLLEKGENVILLANHQAEADPAVLGVLLDDPYPGLIKEMIAVAGARVTTDPMAVPFTRGQNALCVYSKKYFNIHSDKKKEMQQHNSSAMLSLRHQLNDGGKLVYVAPSGGRDRKNDDGILEPAAFDPDSIELMRVVGSKAKRTTHYFPLALFSYPLAPPPEKIKKEIGEQRKMSHTPVHIGFGKKIDMRVPNAEEKKEKFAFRKKQSEDIHAMVSKLYGEITK